MRIVNSKKNEMYVLSNNLRKLPYNKPLFAMSVSQNSLIVSIQDVANELKSQQKFSSINQNSSIDDQSADISENKIRESMPDILDILLIDRTRSTAKAKKKYHLGK